MKILSKTGTGTVAHVAPIKDTNGSGLLPIQAKVTGTASFRLLGRVSKDAPFVEIRSAGTTDFIESFSWVPYLQLEIVSGTGTVDVWVGQED